jgi:hypothetical protein
LRIRWDRDLTGCPKEPIAPQILPLGGRAAILHRPGAAHLHEHSTGRILTTHTGSLPRPADLVATLNARELGEPYDRAAFAERVRRAIDEVVRQQAATGIDVVGDGEHSKFNWMAYARARLEGLAEIDSPVRFRGATRDSMEFAGAYEDLKIMHTARSGALASGLCGPCSRSRPGGPWSSTCSTGSALPSRSVASLPCRRHRKNKCQ